MESIIYFSIIKSLITLLALLAGARLMSVRNNLVSRTAITLGCHQMGLPVTAAPGSSIARRITLTLAFRGMEWILSSCVHLCHKLALVLQRPPLWAPRLSRRSHFKRFPVPEAKSLCVYSRLLAPRLQQHPRILNCRSSSRFDASQKGRKHFPIGPKIIPYDRI